MPDIHFIHSCLRFRNFSVRIKLFYLHFIFHFTEFNLGFNSDVKYINYLPYTHNTFIALYAKDTAIYISAHHPYYIFENLQCHTYIFISWCVKLNKKNCCSIFLNKFSLISITMVIINLDNNIK